MHTNKLGRTYRYVVCEMEDRYGDVGAGQVRGRREIGWLREQQDNVTGSKNAGISTCIKKTFWVGWKDAFGWLTDVVHYHRREQVQRNP